jgi:hypothetical protein
VADAPAFGSAFGVGHHLGLQRGVQLAAQEAEHILRRQVQRGVVDQIGPHPEQLGSGAEHDVGGDLGLVQHPVVAAIVGRPNSGQDRVHQPSERVQRPWPCLVHEPVAQLARGVEILDGEQRVVPPHVAHATTVELAGQPFAAVDVDLALVWDLPLDADVHEPELGVDQIQVVVQALAFPPEQFEVAGLVALVDLEAEARLHRADETDDPFADAVALGDALGEVVFMLGAVAGLDMVE